MRVSSPVRSIALLLVLASVTPAAAQSLRGSSASLDVQNRVAREHDFTFLSTSSQVRRFVDSGYLVPIRPGRDFELHAVSFPYARPEVRTFVERLASQYRAACGERLVVTSLTRPRSRQPRNASDRSVHPTGMAIDLRLSSRSACRSWLENVLLDLERARVLEATREHYPAHYHVAVFPQEYAHYVENRGVRVMTATPVTRTVSRGPSVIRYEVRSGDSLWDIAREHGTTVDRLRVENDLASSRILPGQVLEVPASR